VLGPSGLATRPDLRPPLAPVFWCLLDSQRALRSLWYLPRSPRAPCTVQCRLVSLALGSPVCPCALRSPWPLSRSPCVLRCPCCLLKWCTVEVVQWSPPAVTPVPVLWLLCSFSACVCCIVFPTCACCVVYYTRNPVAALSESKIPKMSSRIRKPQKLGPFYCEAGFTIYNGIT
jgi:hypothetical protein